jgi:tryptophan-rich sensory protein
MPAIESAQAENARRPRLTSLTGNLAAFIVPPLVLNGIIFGLGWNGNTAPSPFLPPGWLVGTIWMVLFTAMGIARWLLVRGEEAPSRSWLVSLLAFLCMMYPLYTLGLRSETIGLAGSVGTAVIAIWVAVRLVSASRGAAALISLVLAWLMYASVALARTMQAGRTL